MKMCPRCGGTKFFVTAHVTQGWIVNEHGDFEEVSQDCIEVTHDPDDDDIWECLCCGYDDAGWKFNVKEE